MMTLPSSRAVGMRAGLVGRPRAEQRLQLQTYPRRSGLPVGLLLNFRALRLKDGLRRFVG